MACLEWTSSISAASDSARPDRTHIGEGSPPAAFASSPPFAFAIPANSFLDTADRGLANVMSSVDAYRSRCLISSHFARGEPPMPVLTSAQEPRSLTPFSVNFNCPATIASLTFGTSEIQVPRSQTITVQPPSGPHCRCGFRAGSRGGPGSAGCACVHEIPCFPKTTGSRGIHIYVPIVRGPLQKDVWTFAKALSKALADAHPDILTAEYKVAKRPDKRVLVDYNQNAWGRTLASVYSVRPKPRASVSAPVTWKEIEQGITIEDFRLDNMRQRVDQVGDLFKPVLQAKNRIKLEKFL